MMCPDTCKIVQQAKEIRTRTGDLLEDILNWYKRDNMYCYMCKRNELSDCPQHMRFFDNSERQEEVTEP